MEKPLWKPDGKSDLNESRYMELIVSVIEGASDHELAVKFHLRDRSAVLYRQRALLWILAKGMELPERWKGWSPDTKKGGFPRGRRLVIAATEAGQPNV